MASDGREVAEQQPPVLLLGDGRGELPGARQRGIDLRVVVGHAGGARDSPAGCDAARRTHSR